MNEDHPRATGSRDRGNDKGLLKYIGLLPVVAMLFAIAGGWATNNSATAQNAKDVKENGAAIAENAKAIQAIKEKLVAIGTKQDRVQEDLKEVGGDVKKILTAVGNKN